MLGYIEPPKSSLLYFYSSPSLFLMAESPSSYFILAIRLFIQFILICCNSSAYFMMRILISGLSQGQAIIQSRFLGNRFSIWRRLFAMDWGRNGVLLRKGLRKDKDFYFFDVRRGCFLIFDMPLYKIIKFLVYLNKKYIYIIIQSFKIFRFYSLLIKTTCWQKYLNCGDQLEHTHKSNGGDNHEYKK